VLIGRPLPSGMLTRSDPRVLAKNGPPADLRSAVSAHPGSGWSAMEAWYEMVEEGCGCDGANHSAGSRSEGPSIRSVVQ
jgi:hypothetical protein